MTPPLISLCIIVKDEAHQIEKCLQSVLFVIDEIIVVDTGSTDGTQEICRQYGAKVIEMPWENSFAKARNCGLKHTHGGLFASQYRHRRLYYQKRTSSFSSLQIKIRNSFSAWQHAGGVARYRVCYPALSQLCRPAFLQGCIYDGAWYVRGSDKCF